MNLNERRHDGSNQPYDVVVPLQCASEAALDEHLAAMLREHFYRHGIADGGRTDAQLLARVRYAFSPSRLQSVIESG